MSTNYEDDPRVTAIEGEEKEALTESDKLYDGMVADNKKTEQGLLDKIDANTQRQEQIQNEQTEFTIDTIEQQKADAKKDYTKEQSGAYVDWQKQSNEYGANAEQKAANGLTNTGFSESSQVSMYNQYQNRVATARESYSRAVVNYNNAITQARLANNAALAEIAAQALAQQLEISLQFVQMNNSLLTQKANAQLSVKSLYQSKWKAMLDQINTEKAQAEQKRQFDATMAFNREQFEYKKAQDAAAASGGGGGGSSGGSGGGTIKKDSGGSSSGGGGAITGGSGNSGGGSPKEPTPNMDSVTALGYGPISAQELNRLVESGAVVEYEKDGQLYYKRLAMTSSAFPAITKNKTIFDKIGDKFKEWF
jgi:hypothetical protein